MFTQKGRAHRLRRIALAAGAAGAIIATACFTSGGVASASATQAGRPETAQAAGTAAHAAPAKPLPGVKVISLHRYYEKALHRVKPGKISGITYARGKEPKPAKRAATAGCSEPNCPLVYNGGSVQHAPRVYLLLWGPNWSASQDQENASSYLRSFYSGLGVQTQDAWSRTTEEYGDSNGYPSFSGSVFGGVWQDSSTPPSGVTQAQLAAEAYSFAVLQGIPDWSNAQVVVATQAGTCPQGFACPGTSNSYCAWHSDVLGLSYINLPYLPDSNLCGDGTGRYDGFSIVGGHEYAETVTDPFPNSGWIDTNDSSGGEIGDKCAWQLGTVTLSTGTFEMQKLWSNDAYNQTGTGCTMGWPDNVTFTSIGSQSTTVHTGVNLQIHATSSASYPLSFSAFGLPPGLSINSATGLVSGTPTVTGSYPVTVQADDVSGGYGSVSFTWTVNGSGDTVTVTSPGTVSSTAGIAASVQIHASSSGGYAVTSYTATGLPLGMGISSTGLISGTARTPGTYAVRVIATDSAGAAGSVTFGWVVSSLPICGGGKKISICCGGPRKLPCLGGHHARLSSTTRSPVAGAARVQRP